MKNILTKELIKKGLEQGIVKIIQNPNDDCISCQIGEYWFYFIGLEDENKTPKEILSSYTQDELCVQIEMAIKGLYIDEQSYYKCYLEEHLKDKEIKKNNKSNKDFVYIVFSGCVGDIGVDAVFKTEDAAKQYIKMNAELYEPFYGKYEVLEEYQPKKEQYLTYNVGFINPETKIEDETQFDVYDFSEISKLFTDFARENHWYNNPKIIYVEQVLKAI